MIRDTTYDEVRDAQRHFRLLLDSLSRPGKINTLAHDGLAVPPGLDRAAACLALALLNTDVSFHLAAHSATEADFIRVNTGSRPAPLATAEFVFLPGTGHESVAASAHAGIATYPETGSTLVIHVAALSAQPLPEALALDLSGPGIDPAVGRRLHTLGLSRATLAAIQERNAEFPLGVDVFLTDPEGRVAGLSRTTSITVREA